MSRRSTQRELRNESGRIMRALDRSEAFTVTRNGVPVGELVPVRPRVFVAAELVAADLPLHTRNPTDFAGLSPLLDIVAV